MNREIKFRLWNIIQKEYVYDTDSIFISIKGKVSAPVINYMGPINEIDFDVNYYDEKQFVIEQFTGLRDKNGVEIYEGDIDKSGNVIKWNSEKAMFALYNKEIRLMSWPLFREEIEFIGNIHENPELLK